MLPRRCADTAQSHSSQVKLDDLKSILSLPGMSNSDVLARTVSADKDVGFMLRGGVMLGQVDVSKLF